MAESKQNNSIAEDTQPHNPTHNTHNTHTHNTHTQHTHTTHTHNTHTHNTHTQHTHTTHNTTLLVAPKKTHTDDKEAEDVRSKKKGERKRRKENPEITGFQRTYKS